MQAGAGSPELAVLPDPLPLQRILVPASRLPLELEKVRQGVLTPVARDAFEARLRKLARSAEAFRNRPTLLQARYVAELKDNALSGRSGTWKVHRRGDDAGVLPIPDLNLAIGSIRNARGAEVLLGEFDEKNLGLWVEESGDVFFDWSARGVARPDGLAFDLRIPAATSATLELILPADMAIVADAGTIPIVGPRDADVKAKKIWLLHVGGQRQVRFVIRHNPKGERTPGLTLSQVQSRIQMTPNWLAADFDVQVDLARASTRQLTFLCDPTLEPFELTARGGEIQAWEVHEDLGSDPKKKSETPLPKKIVVHFREPVQGAMGGIKIRCLGAWTAGKSWTVPFVRLEGGLSRGETIRLTMSPEVRMQSWNNGGFRIVSTTAESDGGQTINLVTTLLHLDGLSRPSAVPNAGVLECEARQSLAWRLLPGTQTFEADIQIFVKQGKLHQFRILGPSGDSWAVASVQVEPKDVLPTWHEEKSFVYVRLNQGWPPAEPLRLKVKWTKVQRIDVKVGELAFPMLTLPDAQGTEGTLAVFLDPLLQARVLNASVSQIPRDPTSKDDPLFRFAFKKKAASGRLEVAPRQTRLIAHVRQEIQLDADAARTSSTFEFAPRAAQGAPLDLLMTPPGLDWKVIKAESDTEEPRLVRNIEREVVQAAALLGSGISLDSVGVVGACPGEWWHLTFLQPIQSKRTITLQGISPRPASGPWALGLTNVPQAERRHGQVRIFAPGDRIKKAHASGLIEVDEKADSGKRVAARSFSLGEATCSALTIETVPWESRRQANALCEQAFWATYLEPGAMPIQLFRFRLCGWPGRSVPVTLPDAEEIVAIRVDGHWHTQPEWEKAPGGLTLTVPVAAGAAQQVDILYRTKSIEDSWFPWQQVRMRPPCLPVAPLRLERRWRLHPDLTPLQRESYGQTGDPEDQVPFDLRGVWHLGDGWTEEFLSVPSTRGHNQAVQRILAAEAALKGKFEPNVCLGEMFARIMAHAKMAPSVLVVDQVALEQAGITAQLKIELNGETNRAGLKSFWDNIGLRLVSGSAGLLLTTEKKAERMRQASGPDWLDGFDRDLRQAREGGQDWSGNFRSLGVWLWGIPPGLLETQDLGLLPESLLGPDRSDFVEFRPLPALADPFSITIVSRRALLLLGAGLALVSVLMLWLFAGWGMRRAWKNRLHLGLVAALAVLYLRSSATLRLVIVGPAAVWTLGLVITYLVFLVRKNPRSKGNQDSIVRGSRALVIGAILFLLWLLQSHPATGQMGKLDSYPVLIVEAEAGGAQTALLAPDLLKKITDMELKSRQRTVRALATGARYSGRWHDGRFEFKARFDVHCSAESATFHLPLSGVNLKEGALLDGAPVFPVAATGVKTGFLIPVQGKGMHRLEILFDAKPSVGAESQEIRFAIPRVARSILELHMPASLGNPTLAACLGEETVKTVSGSNRELVAKLGRGNLIQVNFPLDQMPSAVPVADVRELYYWDLRPLALTLTGVFHYAVAKGSLNQVEIDIPEGIDVRSVELTTAPIGPGLTATSSLKFWTLSGKAVRRRLHVESTAPLVGKFQVLVSLAPRMHVAGDTLALRLPAPQKVKIAESSLAYRLDTGKAREIPQNLTFTTITEEQFAKTWQAAGQRESAAMMTRALTFRRSNNNSGINFRLSAAQSQAVQTQSWTVDTRFSDVKASIAVSGAEDIGLVECTVPVGIHVSWIHGVPIHHWSRTGERIQVWLQNSQKSATLHLEGWKSNESPATSSKAGLVRIPEFSMPDIKVVESHLNVRGIFGCSVEAGGVKGLKSLNRVGTDGLHYESSGTNGVATVRVRQDPTKTWLRTRTRITSEDGNWKFEVTATGDFAQGQEIELEMDSAPDGAMVTTAGRGVHIAPRIGKGKSTWSIRADKTSYHPVFFQARGSIPMREPFLFPVPRLKLAGKIPEQETIELQTADVRFEKSEDAQQIVEESTPKGFSLWRVAPERTRPVLLRAKRPTGTPTLRIGVGQQQALLTCEGKWLHQAAYLLLGRSGSPLRFQLPNGARLRGLLVGDHVLSARSVSGEYVATVPPMDNVGRLQMVWDFTDEEGSARPNLTSPSFPDRVAPTLLGTVAIPAGWERRSSSPGSSEQEQLVLCGEVYAKLARDWAKVETKKGRADVASWLRYEAFGYVTIADWTLAESEEASPLRARAEAVKFDLAASGLPPEDAAKTWIAQVGDRRRLGTIPVGVGVQGPIWRWEDVGESRVPTLELGALRDSRRAYLRRVSDLILVIGFAVFILSLLPRSPFLLRATWPEQWILLAVLGTVAWGLSLLGVLLVAIGIASRATWVILTIGRRFWTKGTVTSRPGSSAFPA